MTSVVFLSVDCLRSDHVGCYGYDRPTTPNIDEFAESATIFENSYANCPGTRWSFQTLHTGAPTHRFDGLGIPSGYRPLASKFKRNGYSTAGFAVNGYISRDFNYDTGFETYYSVSDTIPGHSLIKEYGRKANNLIDSDIFSEYVVRPIYYQLMKRSSDNDSQYRPPHPDARTSEKAVNYIRERQDSDDDFFCWVHFMDAHTPYGRWPDHLEAIRGDTDVEHTIHPGREGLVTPGRDPPDSVIDTYDACVREVDENIGRILEVIDDDVVVVITGDHGEEFGRYNEFHEASLYRSMTQVPIIVRAPELPAGRRADPVQHLDLPVTMLRSAGISIPDHWEGDPLQSVERTFEDPIFFSLSETRLAVRTGDWKYIERDSEAELIDLSSETDRQSVLREHPQVAEQLSTLLSEYRDEDLDVKHRSTDLTGERDELSADVEDNLEDLGYL